MMLPPNLERNAPSAAPAALKAAPQQETWTDDQAQEPSYTCSLTSLGTAYTMLTAAAVIAIFVFALMLQRRSEYATLHARGVQTTQLGVLVLGEVLSVAAGGGLAGLVVGTGMAHIFVRMLRPLFILDPIVALGAPALALILCVAPVMALVAALVATLILRTRTAEMLRET